jgi:hypothetical protein
MVMPRGVQLARAAALALFVVPVWIGGADAAPQLSAKCIGAANTATVKKAYKVEPRAQVIRPNPPQTGAPPPDQSGPAVVSLGDMIAVEIDGLSQLKEECGQNPIVLYVNGYPIKTVRPYPPSAPTAAGASATSGELRFVLRVTDGSKATDGTSLPSTATSSDKSSEMWRPILGRPPWPGQAPRLIEVSVGLDDQYPLKAAAGSSLPVFQLNILGNRWFAVWGGIFVVMVGAFYWCVRHTNIIRNGTPLITAAGGSWARPSAGPPGRHAKRRPLDGTYSLSKFQGALWFFVILAAYLFIGIVTGDYLNSINATALILLGIGAGTVIGAAVIDATKDDPAKKSGAITDTEAKLKQLATDIAAINTQLDTTPPPSNAAQLDQDRLDKEDEKRLVLSSYFKVTGRSESFLTDILSDANGVSFHRFQMAVFTVVLGVVFVRGVYDDLAMPEFNQTLMGLLGLSAGTYLGLKIPEATTPEKSA